MANCFADHRFACGHCLGGFPPHHRDRPDCPAALAANVFFGGSHAFFAGAPGSWSRGFNDFCVSHALHPSAVAGRPFQTSSAGTPERRYLGLFDARRMSWPAPSPGSCYLAGSLSHMIPGEIIVRKDAPDIAANM